jgi:hypothetical protein
MPMSSTVLSKLFRLLFTGLEILAGLSAVAIIVFMLVNPSLPSSFHFGPIHTQVLGQAAEFSLQAAPNGQNAPVFTATAFDGNVATIVNEVPGVITLLKRYGLPLLLAYTLFLTGLFDLLRRLFDNVGRGQSFTLQSVRLIQIVGAALIAFAFVSTIAENWFAHSMYSYLLQHSEITVSGTPLRLPEVSAYSIEPGHWLPLERETFWCGLLVLALAEVFRQGLALQQENELTI